ncbi:hypothetical protein QTP88_024429 [Uroleucon formosanum]
MSSSSLNKKTNHCSRRLAGKYHQPVKVEGSFPCRVFRPSYHEIVRKSTSTRILTSTTLISHMTSDDSYKVDGPLQRCRCDYPQPPDADLITVMAASVDSAAGAVAEEQRKKQQRQRRRDAGVEATEAAAKSFWRRSAALVRRGAARLCPNCCSR